MAAAGVVAGMLVVPTVTGIGPTGTCMPTIRLTAAIGTGITKQIPAERFLPTNPVIGEAACAFVEDHGGRRAWREARGDDINEPVTCGW